MVYSIIMFNQTVFEKFLNGCNNNQLSRERGCLSSPWEISFMLECINEYSYHSHSQQYTRYNTSYTLSLCIIYIYKHHSIQNYFLLRLLFLPRDMYASKCLLNRLIRSSVTCG